MKTMTAQKMNATGGIQAGGKCWTLQIEPPTAKTQYQWRKNAKTKRFYLFTPPLAKFCCVTQACAGENVKNIQT